MPCSEPRRRGLDGGLQLLCKLLEVEVPGDLEQASCRRQGRHHGAATGAKRLAPEQGVATPLFSQLSIKLVIDCEVGSGTAACAALPAGILYCGIAKSQEHYNWITLLANFIP